MTTCLLDEVQKVKGWSEVVKASWDKTCREKSRVQVIILGSSSLLIQKGLSESLAGRFFLYRCTHWTFPEMQRAFSWDMDRWLFFGGYPGAAALVDQENVWSRYVTDSLVETVLAKDVLQLQTVAKPALLRHLFMLSAVHPAQILSYNKMLGQLQDAGNTTTLAHYLKLLETAFLISGLELFKGGTQKKRGSSPKLVIKHFPLKNHKFALKAAKAALAANMQGEFWMFHEELFENYKGLNDKKIQDIAKDLDLDMEKFAKDMNSVAVARMIKNDLLNGRKIGVRGTPSVFINGKILKKRNLAGFSEMIEAELK